jgi:mannose-1-phosphate guanylyltransferase
VRRFVEKPAPEGARACLAAGASWNTFVFVAKVSALREAGRHCVPKVDSLVEQMVRVAKPAAIRRICAAFPEANFSRDILENVTPRLAVRTLTGVTWCDWGSPHRVVASLARLGIKPVWLDQLAEPAETGPAK